MKTRYRVQFTVGLINKEIEVAPEQFHTIKAKHGFWVDEQLNLVRTTSGDAKWFIPYHLINYPVEKFKRDKNGSEVSE